MKSPNRIIVNTAAQYTRTILNVLLSLWSSRIVLQALGENDFGTYSLVAGIVSMLSFFTNALMTSTQRFVSYHQGKGNLKDVERVFNNSLILHLLIGLFLVAVLESISPLLFNGFINIKPERIDAAKIVYQQVLFMLMISFLAAPFKALLVSHENIIYISVIEVCNGVLKLILAVGLLFVNYDKLVTYGCIMSFISLFDFVTFVLYCFVKYEECKLPSFNLFEFKYVKEIFGFTSWILYHSMCIVGRNQGLAILLNKFYDTAINAAFGIGMQVSGAISFISSSLGNAINPQLIKSEGADNRQRVWSLARIQCKYSFLLLAAVSIPAMFEMDVLLKIWLKEVPEYSVFFARMVLSAALLNQLTEGMAAAKQAIGGMRTYTIITSTPKLLVVPLSLFFLYGNAPLYTVALCFVGAETFSSLVRLPMLCKLNNFNISEYYNQVIKKVFFPVLCCLLVCYAMSEFVNLECRFILTFVVSIISFSICVCVFSMEKEEKTKMKELYLNAKMKSKPRFRVHR